MDEKETINHNIRVCVYFGIFEETNNRIEESKNIKKEWEVDEYHIPFYGDWHDLFCLDLKTNKVLYLDDDRNVIFAWDSITHFKKSLTRL